MPTNLAAVVRAENDDLQRAFSPAMSTDSRPPLVRGRMGFWLVFAILGAIVLVLAWLVPPASSYRVANPKDNG